MRPLLSLAAWVLTVPALPAEEPVAASYGEGLERLAALGLPPMKDAAWVRRPKEAGESFLDSYYFRELGVRLQGGAWKLAGEPVRYLEFGGPAEYRPEASGKAEEAGAGGDEKPAGLLGKMLKKHAEENPVSPSAPKKKGLAVEEDVRLLVEALGKEKVQEELRQQVEYGSAELPGRCLLFAAQLHAAGREAEADRLAAAIFGALPSPEPVIDAAVSRFASAGYQAAAGTFFTDYDWSRYLESVKALLAKYPRGWGDAGAVAMLVPLLEKRAAGEKPAALALPGIELAPAAVEALDALLLPSSAAAADDETLARSHGVDLSEIPAEHRARYLAMLRQHGMGGEIGAGLWILEAGEKTGKAPADPIGKLRAMGMDGLIALAAAVTDETLIPVRNTGDRSSYFYRSSNQSAEEIAAGTFKTMDRPRTRGELAREWLVSTLPRGEDSEDLDAPAIRQAAVEFWKNHRGKGDVELALVFLSSGSDSQIQEAAAYLAGHESPEAARAFEKAVLSAGDPAAFASVAESYLEARKDGAKDFFAAYSKVLREALEGIDTDDIPYSTGSYVIREAGGVEKYLKKLSLKVGNVSLKETLAAAVATGKKEEVSALRTVAGSAGVPEIMAAVGAVAGEAPPGLRMELLYLALAGAFRGADEGSAEPPSVPLPAETLALWKPLLAWQEALPEEESDFTGWLKGYGAKTGGDAAAIALEISVFPGSGASFNPYGDISESLGAVTPFVRQRVEAWIEGKEPPAWPAEAKVSEERKREIAAKLAGLPAGELLPYARSLPPDERLFVSSTLRGYDEEHPAPAGVVALRKTVVACRAYNPAAPHDPAILAGLGIADGYRLSQEGLEGIAAKMAVEAEERSGTVVMFNPGPMGLGCTASAFRNPAPESHWGRYFSSLGAWFRRHEDAGVLSMLTTGRSGDLWSAKDGKAVKLENPNPNPAGGSLKELLESGDFSNPLHISILVQTRADAEKPRNE